MQNIPSNTETDPRRTKLIQNDTKRSKKYKASQNNTQLDPK